MTALEAMYGEIWGFWVTGLIHGTVLAAMTWILAHTVLRRARPALMTALWTIVLIKFLLPVGPEVPVSMSGLVNALMNSTGQGDSLIANAAHGGSAGAFARSTAEMVWVIAQGVLIALYVVLVVFLFARRLAVYRGHRRFAEAQPEADAELWAAVHAAARIVGMRVPAAVRMSDHIAAPQIIGMWRPVLLVPRHLRAQPVMLEAALLHELAHLRRHDTWLRCLQLVAATLLFFWPVVRWVNRRIDDHREMACDQWAIAWGRLSASAYARVLVEMVKRAQSTAGAAEARAASHGLGMAFVRSRKQLVARVDGLMRGGRARPRIGLTSGLGLLVWALICLGGSRGTRADIVIEPAECVIQPGVIDYILATFPEADVNGDGELSRDEVCAHQRLLKELGEMSATGDSAERMQAEVQLASLEPSWIDCQSCGCMANEPGAESVSLDKKICSNEDSR